MIAKESLKPLTLLALLALSLLATPLYASDYPVYELLVRVTPETHKLEGTARIALPEQTKAHITWKHLALSTMRIDGGKYEPLPADHHKGIEVAAGTKTVEIEYTARFKAALPEDNIHNEGVVDTNVVEASGVMLLSDWYPELSMPCIYQLTVLIPEGFEPVSESDEVLVSHDGDYKKVQFKFPHPTPGITLVAGHYHVTEEHHNGTKLKTYFFEENAPLAHEYLAHTKEYLRLYESLLGPYPYESFSVVENTLQTGYSFPTFTLLGSKVLGLPFIVETSLGHEVLHQWFGNYVYVNHAKGNWVEGLTTYLADHWYDHMKGRGSEYRKRILIDYENYVSPEDAMSLEAFKRRVDYSSRSVGYGKGAMVFHMLRKMVGDEDFFESLRNLVAEHKYHAASWDEIKGVFGSTCDNREVIDQFFAQWVPAKSVPSFDVNHSQVLFREGYYNLTLDIEQEGEHIFTLDLPLKVVTASSEKRDSISIDKKNIHYEERFLERPLAVIIDEDYDIMRSLGEAEMPPVISGFTGSKESIVYLPEKDKQEYGDVADFLVQQGYPVKDHVVNEELKNHSILMFSPRNRLYRRLFAGRSLSGSGCAIKVYHNPFNPRRVILVFQSSDTKELSIASKKIFKYGNYSSLQFENGKNIAKAVEKTAKGIVLDLSVPIEAVAIKRTMDLDRVIQKVKTKRVVFVGETHDNYAHHLAQRGIIEGLHKENRQLMIGMEMFQRPFQEYLDQYIAGEINEEDLLKRTEYFKRWSFDYNLYRDILHFARAQRIPVIALNLRREIIEKVAQEGIDSLTEKMYAEIPRDLDMTNRDYKKSMVEVFAAHANNQERDFENFFQSQILWDETMAHTIAAAMDHYPKRQMVVLAGNGHLQYSWGIPARVERLTHERGSVILNGGGHRISRELADFVLFPDHRAPPETPKLQVLVEEDERGVVVKEVMKGGVAEKAGIQEGDLIRTVDQNNIADIADLKISLMGTRKGSTIKVEVERHRPVLGAKELVFDVPL